MTYYFEVAGHPVGKEQPRKGEYGNFYTPPKTVEYKTFIRLCFCSGYGKLDDKDHRWRLDLKIYYKGRCDYDKVANAFNDALSGFLWHNDEQIDEVHIDKVKVKDKDLETVVVHATPRGEE